MTSMTFNDNNDDNENNQINDNNDEYQELAGPLNIYTRHLISFRA